jgi:hypothetical protein
MTVPRQVYSQPARSAEELRRRNVRPIPNGHVWDGADHIGWIENGDVFSTATKQKIATLDPDGNLYALDGQSLNLSLETVNGGGRIAAGGHSHAIAKFRSLGDGSGA